MVTGYLDKYIYVWKMRYCIQTQLKFKLYKQFCGVLFVFLLGTLFSFAQKPHLDESLFKEGLLELKFKESWRYQPGDNSEWANPEFDDSEWYNIDPIGLKAYQMPDSLWKGFGWWRITFTADPKTIEAIERLYFSSWGLPKFIWMVSWWKLMGIFLPIANSKKHIPPITHRIGH